MGNSKPTLPINEDGSLNEGIFSNFFVKVLMFLNKGKIEALKQRYQNDPRIMKAAKEYMDAVDDLEASVKAGEKDLADLKKYNKDSEEYLARVKNKFGL